MIPEESVWPSHKLRSELPSLLAPEKPGIIGLLKQHAGTYLQKYLHSEVYPISCYEPLTELQRRLEGAQYAYLLNEAATMAASSARRLAKVAAFNVGFWASSGTRSQYKALRPLPGETFEFLDRDLGILMLGENGLSLIYNSKNAAEVVFKDGDKYHMNMPPGRITGLKGPISFAHEGSAVVKQLTTGLQCIIDLREPSLLSRGRKHETGDKENLWTAHPCATRNGYSMGSFAVKLNDMPDALARILPSTDSRLRPDSRYLESQHLREAELARCELIESSRVLLEGQGLQRHWRWFKPLEQPVETCSPGRWLHYRYNGGYWEARAEAQAGNLAAWQLAV